MSDQASRKRPLWLDGVVEPRRGSESHCGLWYDKFCDRWLDGWHMTAVDKYNPKLAWIEEIAGTTGSQRALHSYAKRVFELVESRGGETVVVTAQTRFVTGLGLSHPVENGFAWHPTLGTPYLPASSLKGLTRAWAEDTQDEGEVKRLLGDRDHAGAVAFLDAVPLYPVKLEADVLTPHYANWSDKQPPSDWRSPVPVPFLVAAKGTSLLCGVIPLRSERSNENDAATVRDWLVSALDDRGAGAKTAVGYGHFREDTRETVLGNWRQERRRREAMATPEGRWRVVLESQSEQDLLTEIRRNLINGALVDPQERRAFVLAVLERGMVGLWRRGQRADRSTNVGDRKLKEYGRVVCNHAAEFGLEIPE